MNTRRLILSLLLSIFLQIGYAQPSNEVLTSTSVETDYNLIFLPISIHQQEFYMILDTGAGFSVIDEAIAQSLNLQIENVQVIERPGGDVRLGSIAQLTYNINDLEIQMPIASANLSEGGFNNYIGRECAGILGYDFISQYAFEIDYETKQLSIMDTDKFLYQEGKKMEMNIVEGMPIVSGIVHHDNQMINGRWLIDTGSLMSLGLNESFYKEYFAENTSPLNSIAVGFGGSTPGKMYKLDGFELGDFQFSEIIAGHPENGINDETFDGVLGGELLGRFKIAFNYASNEIYFIPNSTIEHPIRWDLSGMLLAHSSKGIEILHVFDSSSAASENIQVGDIIKTINGQHAEELSLPKIWTMFHHQEGEEFVMEIMREDNLEKKTLHLFDYFK